MKVKLIWGFNIGTAVFWKRGAMYVGRNVGVLSSIHCCGREAISITYCECVFVASGIEREMGVRHIVSCDLPGSKIFFPHFLIKGSILGKERLLNIIVNNFNKSKFYYARN